MKMFSRTRSNTSATSSEKSRSGNATKTEVAVEELEAFGVERFQKLVREKGTAYALEQVAAKQRQAIPSNESFESDTSYSVEDTDVWCSGEGIECVLGAI